VSDAFVSYQSEHCDALLMMLLELSSSGPETVVLNADAVYVTTYSVLHLTMTLHRSAYFTSAEKSLPLSEVMVVSLFTCCEVLQTHSPDVLLTEREQVIS